KSSVCKPYHAVARQEILTCSKNRRLFYRTGNSFKSMDVICLYIMNIFFSCFHWAHSMTLDYARNRICTQNSKSMVDRAPRTCRTASYKVSFFYSPYFNKIGPERHYKLPG